MFEGIEKWFGMGSDEDTRESIRRSLEPSTDCGHHLTREEANAKRKARKRDKAARQARKRNRRR